MPDWNRYVRDRLSLHLRPEREAEIVNELAQQLEQKYSDLLAAGLAAEEALHGADAQVGDWRALAQQIANAEAQAPPDPPSRIKLVSGLRHDVFYALRFLRRKPVFATIATATLAFGIGANTAMFTIVDAVALRGLPYRDADRLVTLGAHREKQPDIAPFTSAPDFFDLRKQAKSFDAIAGITPVWNMITGDAEAERLECMFISANFLPMLGVSPVLGRNFQPSEDAGVKGSKVAILGYSYWQRKFGGSANVLNQRLDLDGDVYTIIGVLPASFKYAGEPLASAPTEIAVYLPLAENPLIATARSLRFMKVAARLAPGKTVDQARDELRRIGAGLAEQYPPSNREMAWELQSLHEEAVGRYRAPVLLLLGAVGFVLLLASANVANLLLARVAERKQEMSIRTALGASSYRILRQLLAESLLLSALGGLLGTGLAALLLRALIAIGPPSLMRSQDIRIDLAALAFTAAIVMLSAVLSGLLPAWRTVKAELGSALRAGARSVTSGTYRFRSGLVIVQVALALVLLVGAGLLIRSFQHLLMVDPGFRAENLVTISTQIPTPLSQTAEQRTALYGRLRQNLLAIPGVEDVAAVSRLPMMGSDLTSNLFPEGKPMTPAQAIEVQYRRTTPNYFKTMGMPLLRGRAYDDHDSPATPVALVDELTARMMWPGEDAVGKRIKVGNPEKSPWTTVIGVTRAARFFGLDAAPRPMIYVPYAESPLSAPILVIRTTRDPLPIVNSLVDAVRGVAKGMPAYNVFTMRTLVDRSTAQRRFLMMLLTAFAAAAMLLAAVGVYGSISHTVSQRTRELGLRIALGASPAAALRLILAEGLRLTTIGIAIGALAAVLLTRLMQSALFGVRPLDPLVFAASAATIGAISFIACGIPALRATHVDPLVALREE